MNFIIKWLLGQLLKCFGSIYQLMGAMSGSIFDQSVIKALFVLSKSIGLSLVGLAIISLLFKTMIDNADGKEFNISDILKRCIGGVVIYTYGVNIMLKFYTAFLSITGDIIKALSGISMDGFSFSWEGAVFQEMSSMMSAIMVIIAIFYLMKSFLNMLERSWQYLVLLCMMYLYLSGYILGNDESLLTWFKQCLAVVLTQFFQVCLVTLGMVMFASKGGTEDFCFAIGAIIASSKIEQLLDKYGMGAGGKVGNAARNAMSMGFYASNIFKGAK